MNFILGWILVSYLFTQGVLVPGDEVFIEGVSENSPAYEAGLQEDDIIHAIITPDGERVVLTRVEDLIDNTNEYVDQEIELEILRNNQSFTAFITPRSDPPEGQGAMGVVISNLVEKKYSIIEAPIMGFKQVFEILRLTATGIGSAISKALTLQGDQAEVTGPLGIGKLVGEARRFGVNAVIELAAILSINLAFINLLPFPALDGGRLAFVIVEGTTGKKIKPNWEMYLHQIGMVFLLALILLITINDILRLGAG